MCTCIMQHYNQDRLHSLCCYGQCGKLKEKRLVSKVMKAVSRPHMFYFWSHIYRVVSKFTWGKET